MSRGLYQLIGSEKHFINETSILAFDFLQYLWHIHPIICGYEKDHFIKINTSLNIHKNWCLDLYSCSSTMSVEFEEATYTVVPYGSQKGSTISTLTKLAMEVLKTQNRSLKFCSFQSLPLDIISSLHTQRKWQSLCSREHLPGSRLLLFKEL